MIKFDNSKEPAYFAISGDPVKLATETLAIVTCIRDAIEEHACPDAAEVFAHLFRTGVPYTLLSRKERDEENKRMIEKARKMEDMLEMLKKTFEKEELDKDGDVDIRSADFCSDEEFRSWFHGDISKEDDKSE